LVWQVDVRGTEKSDASSYSNFVECLTGLGCSTREQHETDDEKYSERENPSISVSHPFVSPLRPFRQRRS
jgi:hypothetical protein